MRKILFVGAVVAVLASTVATTARADVGFKRFESRGQPRWVREEVVRAPLAFRYSWRQNWVRPTVLSVSYTERKQFDTITIDLDHRAVCETCTGPPGAVIRGREIWARLHARTHRTLDWSFGF